ncbi:aminopeptidase N-like [Anopheles stephensi]|uniref:aminopeptidase N-like n=1 Tax=Anopheles stephensi TaxID=30069 RepID=UPI001658C1A1|nr:aminopeptidase N-like [Anopheles stephensi]
MTNDSFTSYSGTVDITIKYTGNGSSFSFNSVNLVINETSVRVTRVDGTEVPLKSLIISRQFEQLHFEEDEMLETDASYKVHLGFTGQIKTDFFKGIYRSSYWVGSETKYLATTFLAATYARSVFPCYDEPAYKARFNVKIRHLSHHTALSNMPVTNSLQFDGYSETTFDTTPLMSTYLVAFVVSEMKTLSSDQELFRVFAPENKVNDTIYAHDFAVRAVRALETHFGRQNKMPKIDLVGIPDFAMGAMENWGLITFREDYLIYEGEEVTTAFAKQRIASVITHELVHMWFGNEVTPEWWTYVWLNEGFANLFEYYITSQLEPSWMFWEQFVLSNVHTALSKDCHSSARAMNYYATDPAILNELYDYVVYDKSASVIRMMQSVIGIDTFRQAINDYLRSRSYLSTRPEYLYTSIEKFRTVDLPASVEAIFESWANAPGYPVVTVTVDRTKRTLTASQKRFWMPNEVVAAPENKLFYIPLNYASSVSSSSTFEDTAPTFWLTPTEPTTTISIESGIEWLVVNKQQTGYYRVNYDEESWHKLITVLNSDRFDELVPVINRAQLVDDVANLARAGEVGYDVALSLMQYLERETEFVPWGTAYTALLHLDQMFSSNKEYIRFESFGRSITSHVFNNTMGAEGTHLNRLHRDNSVYLACYFGVPACLKMATDTVQAALREDTLTMPKELQSAVFCALHKHELPVEGDYGIELLSKFWQATDQYQQLIDMFIGAPVDVERIPTARDSHDDNRYLLQRVSEPISYDLFLDITNYYFYSYSGTVEIKFRYIGDQNHFYLHSDGLVIEESSVKVTRPDDTNLPVANLIHMEQFEQIYFGFGERLQTGEVYKIQISFLNSIGTELKGLYRSSYVIGNTTRYLATTHFESTYARSVFPCYDEPAYKATFKVRIRHRPEYTALSNMPVYNSTTVGDYTETTFDTTPEMSTYLLAFVISDFKTISQETDRFRIFAAEHKVSHTEYALEFLGKSLRTLETLFGHQYQLPKVDLIAIPDFAMGAMENWGLITFREQYLIYEEGVTTARTKQNIADLITHELTHMWFGNEVTPDWWTYLWLSEGFARYFEYYVTSQLEPSWNLWEQFIVNNVHSALSQDCFAHNRMMSYYATDPAILNDLFDYVVYAKSASVIRMIQNVIGFDTFRQALNDYLRSRSYLTTKPEYLYTSIEKFRTVDLPASVEAIFESWANAPGYPVVTVTVDRTKRTLTASQKRFWMPNEVETAPENKLFYIPLNYASSVSSSSTFEDTAPTFWLTPTEPTTTISIESGIEWLVVNKQQTGYYRVNYDEESWHKLITVLNSDRFDELVPVINRAQLVDDVANLARAGEVGYNVALSLMQYLERETEYIPWSTAYNALLFLDRMYSGAMQYERLASFIRSITGCMYENILLTGPMDHISRLHRGNTVYLACYSGVQTCLVDANALATKAVEDPTYTIPEEVQPAVFCALHKYPVAALNVQRDLFERYVQSAKTPQQLEMVNRFLTSIGCAQNETDLEYYLALTSYNYPGLPITAEQRNKIYLGLITGSPTTRLTALRYMHEHFSTVTYLLTSVTSIFTELGNRINSRLQYEMLKNIVDEYGATLSTSARAAADAALVQANQNIQWVEKHSEHITSWLVEKEYEGTTEKPPGGGTVVHSVGMLAAFGSTLILLASHAILL